MGEEPPAVQETPEIWVQSQCREDPLAEGMAAHSRTLAWRIPWTEESGGYSTWGHKESDTTERLSTAHSPQLTQSAVWYCTVIGL